MDINPADLIVPFVFREMRRNVARRSDTRQTRSARSWRERGKTERPKRQHSGKNATKRSRLKLINKSKSELENSSQHCLTRSYIQNCYK